MLITVYITNYNYGQYLSKAVDSVLNQSTTDFELIIIDDGSIDNSLIAQSFTGRKTTHTANEEREDKAFGCA